MSKLMLTDQQRAVVENRGGSLLVSAAAGSGKTKVLVERLFHYITNDFACIDDFLIITYTKAAAAELRSKIAAELSKRLGEDPGNQRLKAQILRVYQADIKTIDAFCTALLRENTHLLARTGEERSLTPDFRVLDDSEAKLIRQRVLDRVLDSFYEGMERGSGEELLADTLGAGRDDRSLANLVLELYSKLQSHAYPEQWLRKNLQIWSSMDGRFDDTVYAQELLLSVKRTAEHWASVLRRSAERTEGDAALFAGYGEKFLAAAEGFSVLACAESWGGACRAARGIVFSKLNTPRGRKDDPDVAGLKNIWDQAKSAVKKFGTLLDVTGEEAMEDLREVAPAMIALLTLTEAFAAAYRKEKLRLNAADFSDQEHLALELLVREDGMPTELGAQVAARYREILVDEYQDTNEVQNAIFRAVSKDGNNLFTVGDVKQSIYRFRLADPTIFLEKYQRFKFWKEAKDGEERKILLSRNFRSRREILDAANFLFENILSREMGEMEYGEEEALHFGAEYYPERQDCYTEFHLISAQQKTGENSHPVKKVTAEARFVAKRIRQLLDKKFLVTEADGTFRPCRPEDIVILMRSPGSRAAAFAEALAERDIPCSFEENSDFFHTMEISVMMSLLELVDNPRQDVPLISVLRSPIFRFTPDRLADLRGKTPKGDFYDAVVADQGEDCRFFLNVLRSFRMAARDMSVYRLVWHIYNTLNVLGVFGAMDRGVERRENLIAFSNHAEKFESGGYKGVFAFVTQLRRLLESNQPPITKSASVVGGVRLMSIHKSKGLEFPVVILADLDHAFSRQDFEPAVLVHAEMGAGPNRVDLQRKIKYPTLARLAVEEKLRRENLSEEQRILYVAMTRPKEKLILVDSMYFAQGRLQKLAAMASCPVDPETVAAGKTFGDWILLPLLCRPEADKLRAYADVTVETLCQDEHVPWQVFLHDSEEFRRNPRHAKEQDVSVQADGSFDPELLEVEYPYARETMLPAKVTATQLKGRLLDEEIAEHTYHVPRLRQLSQPRFRQPDHGLTPAERGTATHLVLQYLDFNNPDVESQINMLQERRKLTSEQAAAVDIRVFQRFMNSDLAREIRGASQVMREYRFTVLMDAQAYDPLASGEDSILLQGVVDCWFENSVGITVVDFKTDRVETELETLQRAETYRAQLAAYSSALEKVLEKKVIRRVLYFLHSGKMVEV